MKEARWPVEEADTLLPFLLAHAKGSRNTVKALLTAGKVLVDGRPVTRYDHPLAPGQTVSLAPKVQQAPAEPPFPILYEDSRLLAVDKPAGLLTIATEKEKLRTAYRAATDYAAGQRPGGRVFIVHRLDRDTSGVLLFAKDEAMKRALQDNWERLVRRRSYVAVVEGEPPEEAGVLRSFLRETATHLVYAAPTGKEAITRYRVLARGRGHTLLGVEIDTGRKNQIRAQLSELGCPIAGDKVYGAKGSPLGRLCLHADALWLQDPLQDRALTLNAPAPRAFFRLCGQGGAQGRPKG